jgi:hypothetical protein
VIGAGAIAGIIIAGIVVVCCLLSYWKRKKLM